MQEKFYLSIQGFYIFTSIILLINRFPSRKIKFENILISHEKKYGNCKVIYLKKLKSLIYLFLLTQDYNKKVKKIK